MGQHARADPVLRDLSKLITLSTSTFDPGWGRMQLHHWLERTKHNANSVVIVLLVCTSLISAFVLVASVRSLRHPGEDAYPEGSVVQNVLWSLTDDPFYHGVDSRPFTPAPYGAFFYWQLSQLARLTGGNVLATMRAARILVFSYFLLLPDLVVLLLRRWGINLLSSLGGRPACDFERRLLALERQQSSGHSSFILRTRGAVLHFFRGGVEYVGGRVVHLCSPADEGLLPSGALAITAFCVWTKKWRAVAIFLSASGLPVVVTYAVLQMRHDPALHHLALLRHSVRCTRSDRNPRDWPRRSHQESGLSSRGGVVDSCSFCRSPGACFRLVFSWVMGARRTYDDPGRGLPFQRLGCYRPSCIDFHFNLSVPDGVKSPLSQDTFYSRFSRSTWEPERSPPQLRFGREEKQTNRISPASSEARKFCPTLHIWRFKVRIRCFWILSCRTTLKQQGSGRQPRSSPYWTRNTGRLYWKDSDPTASPTDIATFYSSVQVS